MWKWIVYFVAGAGAGVVTGLAGLSAAVVITPLLVSFCGWDSYDAVTVALASDVLASFLTATTYRKNKNIDLKRGMMVGTTALTGTVIGSYSGYLFNQAQPGGLGLISMLTTISLGIKFLVQPVSGGADAETFREQKNIKTKTAVTMAFGLLIGWVCGFTGSGGGIMMLTAFTLILGYNLKVAVGTGTMIMTAVALIGAVSHIGIGAVIHPAPTALVVFSCAAGARIAAVYANRCDSKKLNYVIGIVLLFIGSITIITKFILQN